jgi:hypothetical protein
VFLSRRWFGFVLQIVDAVQSAALRRKPLRRRRRIAHGGFVLRFFSLTSFRPAPVDPIPAQQSSPSKIDGRRGNLNNAATIRYPFPLKPSINGVH